MGDPAVAALRGAFSALELIVGIMLAVLSPVVDACGRRARVLYRWAHFIVGCLIALLGSVAVSAALALPAWTTFAVVAALWWSVFLPTEDLVAMHRSGHVSPAYVRFALLALADVVGARDVHKTYVDESDDESEEDERASDDEGNANVVAGSSPGKGAATRPVGSAPRDASDAPSNAWREAERLRDRKLRADERKRAVLYRQVNRHVMVPLRVAMRAILRWQGLISSSEEERLELERLRREARAASGGGGDDFNRKESSRGVGAVKRRVLPHPSTWPHRPVFVRFNPRADKQRALGGWATRWGPDLTAKVKTLRELEEDERVREELESVSNGAATVFEPMDSEDTNAGGDVGNGGGGGAGAGSKGAGSKVPSPVDTCCPVNTETWMNFESELFVGKIVCRFKGIGCPANPAAVKTKDDFFKTQKRCTFQVLVQGRFKERVRASEIQTGGEFGKPFQDVPPHYLIKAGCKFFQALTPGLEIDLLCDEPYYMALLGGTVTTLAIDETEDKAVDPRSDVAEDNGRMFGGEGYSVSRRSRTLGNPDTAAEYWYNTTDVYTFDYFQSVLLFDEYCLDIGIVKLRLDRHLNGNPICIMAKHVDGRYVYNFEIFHECLLSKSDQAPPGYGAKT